MIQSITYFENSDMSCQIGFGYQDENDILKNNPPFISVCNNEEQGVIYVENTHEYEEPIKLGQELGFWRVNYK